MKQCLHCDDEIPAKRLQAMPNADTCVRCLERQGDVPRILKFDEYYDKGEDFIELYTNKITPYLAEYMESLGMIVREERDIATGRIIAFKAIPTVGDDDPLDLISHDDWNRINIVRSV